MPGHIRLTGLLFIIGAYLTPVYAAEDIASENPDLATTEDALISPANRKLRSILEARDSYTEESDAVQTGNYARIYQSGTNNNAAIKQKGNENQSYIEQNGDENRSLSSQRGRNNQSQQIQKGTRNNAVSIQYGANNISRQIQYGNGLNSRVTQFGNNKRILIRQGL